MISKIEHTSQQRVILKTRQDLAKRIDDTRLVFHPSEKPEDLITALCHNALRENFRAVCIRPEYVKQAKILLKNSSVMIATVIGFPKAKESLADQQHNPTVGSFPWEAKALEMTQAKSDGADEFDVVMDVARFKSSARSPEGHLTITQELEKLVTHADGTPIKLIIETDLLTPEEIILISQLALKTGIHFMKTSTGMLEGGVGATPRNVELIYKTLQESSLSPKPGIKASGGIRTANQAVVLLQAGADVIGSSAGSQLLDDFEAKNPFKTA